MTPVWPTIERFLAEHDAAALITLAESAGSNLREIGVRTVVRAHGRFSRAIGDRALEWLALAEAQQMAQLLIHRDAVATATSSRDNAAVVPTGASHA